VWAIAIDALLPRFCLGCGVRLPPRGARLDLCARCRGRLVAIDPVRACSRCSRPLARSVWLDPTCQPCAREPPPWRRLHALWIYRPPLDRVIGAMKFRRLDYLGADLARAALDAMAGRLAPVELVVPVPLAWSRRLTRGFNQAERLARPLARGLGAGFAQPLRRAGAGARQVGKTRRQRLRLAGVNPFRVRRDARLAGRRVLLVDDVLTTGATVRAATAALLTAGVAGVEVLVAAWTPPAPGGPAGTGAGRGSGPA
jgi:ComF family protein